MVRLPTRRNNPQQKQERQDLSFDMENMEN